MKILMIGAYPPPYGGWSRRLKVVQEALDRAGHTCMVLNTGENRWPPAKGIDGFRTRREFISKIWSYSREGFSFQLHTNGANLLDYAITWGCRLATWIWGNKLAVSFHGGPDQPYLLPSTFWLRMLARFTYTCPDHIVCDSELVRARLILAGAAPEKVSAISPFTGQYIATINPPVGELAQFLDQHTPIITSYAYVLSGVPNLEVYLQAIQTCQVKYPHLGSVLLGDGEVKKAWLALVGQDENPPGIIWQENLPAEQFLGLLEKSQVYLRNSPTDGVAASVLEALALGTPVVASRLPGRPPETYQYDLLDYDDLVEKLHQAIEAQVAKATGPREIPETVSTEVKLLEKILGQRRA